MDLRSLLSNAQSSITNTYDNSVDSLIDRLGLERQSSASDSILPAIGIFSAGLAVGAALGLIFAPKKGEDLREDINDQLDHLKDRMDNLSLKTRQQYEDLSLKTRQQVEDLLLRGEELVGSAKQHLPNKSDVEEAAHKVERKAKHAADEVSDAAHQAAEKVGHGAHKAADKVETAAEKAAAAAEKVAHDAKEKVEKAVSHAKK